MPVTSSPLGCERPHPRCSFALTLWGTGSSGAAMRARPRGARAASLLLRQSRICSTGTTPGTCRKGEVGRADPDPRAP